MSIVRVCKVWGRKRWKDSKRNESSDIIVGCLYNELISVKLGRFLIVKKQAIFRWAKAEKKERKHSLEIPGNLFLSPPWF